MEESIFSLKVTYDNKTQVITLEGIDALGKDGSSSIRIAEVAQLHFLLTTIQELIKNNIKSEIVKVPDAQSCINDYLQLETSMQIVSPTSRSSSFEPFIFRADRVAEISSKKNEVASPRNRSSSPGPFIFHTKKSPEISPKKKEVRSTSPSPQPFIFSKRANSPVRSTTLVEDEEEECTIIPYKSRSNSLPLNIEGKIDIILESDFKEKSVYKVLSNNLIIEEIGPEFGPPRTVQIWQVEDRKKILQYEGNVNMSNPLGLPNGKIFGSINDYKQGKYNLVIFNPKTGKSELTSEEYDNSAYAFRLINNCQIIGIIGGNVAIWNLNTLKLSLLLSNQKQARDFDILPDGYILVAAHYGVQIWDSVSNNIIQKLDHTHVMSYSDRREHELYLKSISNDKFITSTTPGIQIWTRSNGEKLPLIGTSGIWGFLVLNNKWIAARSKSDYIPATSKFSDSKIKIWDIETGEVVSTLDSDIDEFKTKLVLCSSEQIGVSSNNKIILWNFKTNTSKIIYEGEYIIDFGVFQDDKIYIILGKEIYYKGRSTPDIKFTGIKIIS